MLCEHANPQLTEFAAGELAPSVRQAIESHINDCATCQADYDAISQFSAMATNWHDELVPAWTPPRMASRDWFENFRLWFPTAASTAALAMATLIFVQMPQTTGSLPVTQTTQTNYDTLPPLPQATQAAMVQSVMDGSREQRQQELQALLKILKAEMDKRSIQTEESLRFVISNQLQGQQELDDLYKQVEVMMLNPDQTSAATTDAASTGLSGEISQ